MPICIPKSILISIILNPSVLFSQDYSQYPDTIIDSYNTLTKTSDQFFGGTISKWGWLVPLNTILHKSDTFISLPLGSYVIVGFTNNYIVDAPDQTDIYVEEVGGAGEYADISVSSDNVDYTFLGTAGHGKINEFDLAKIKYTKHVSYIKIMGKDANGESPGFDLRSVYGLPGSNRMKTEVPVILENVLFLTNKANLLPESFASLDILVHTLHGNAELKIEIRGHTDSIGSEADNQILSEQRAKAVFDYLLSKGIDHHRLSYKGFGSTQPIASNETEEGRKRNRRVEFVKVK
jgi:outer membrane protein OmpA-like peptidoglycan-associated protein